MRHLFVVALAWACLLGLCGDTPAQDATPAERPELVDNGSLDKPDPAKKDRQPVGWMFVDGNRRWGKQGTLEYVDSPTEGGGKAVRLEKTVAEAWYPQLMQKDQIGVEPGKTYRATATVQSTVGFQFRYVLDGEGQKTRKLSKAFPASDKMKEVSFTFTVPARYDKVRLGLHIIQQKGAMTVDNISLVETDKQAAAGPLMRDNDEAAPDAIHGLAELSRRSRVMPRHLLVKDDTWRSERVVFKDTATGATVHKLTRAPGSTRHQYSNMQPWNADGSRVKLLSNRDGRGKFWVYLLTGDGSTLTARHYSATHWCPVHPERLFFREWVPETDLQDVGWWNVFDNTKHVIGRYPKGGMVPPSHDGKKLLMVMGGYSRDREEPAVGHVVDVETGAYHKIDFGFVTHQVWFTKRADYTISLNYAKYNPHYVPDRHEGSFLIDFDGGNLRKIRARRCTHRGFSPTGRRVAFHHGGIRVMNVDGTQERVVYKDKGGHLSWQVSPEWVDVTSGNAIRRIGMNRQGFAFRIACPNTQLGFSEYWTEAHLDSSPDGTKIAFASSMLGDTDFYWAVAALPQAPRHVMGVVAEGEAATVAWQRPERSKELKGYLVYRSDRSGEGYVQVTPSPITETVFREKLPAGTRQVCYVVTAVEHSGLESMPSGEVQLSLDGPWTGPRRRYYEAEDGAEGGSATWHFDAGASNLYGYRAGSAEPAYVSIPVAAAEPGYYTVWARIGCPTASTIRANVSTRTTGTVKLDPRAMGWVKLGELAMKRGANDLVLKVTGMDCLVDQVFLTSDADDKPAPRGLLDVTPPAAPKPPRPFARDPYAVALRWLPSPEPDVAHYNVYCSMTQGFRPEQQHLVASPVAPEVVDWGLKHSTVYYYRLTAVDRRGNESAPSPEIAVTTEAGGEVMLTADVGKARQVEPATVRNRTFDEKTLKQLKAWADTRHRLPEDGALTVTVDVPRDGQYLVWVRSAPVVAGRGSGLNVTLNDERIPWRPAYNYVSIGHAGPTPGVFMWDTVQSAEADAPQLQQLEKGKLTITIATDGKTVADIDRIVITDNLGWTPEGIFGWLPAR